MKRAGEDGAILLMVLVGLALLAALAGLVLRVSKSDLSALSAERAAFHRENLIQSALATLGVRLPADYLPEDGTPVSMALPGGNVTLRIYAAQGLINPNFTRAPVLKSALLELGATPDQAIRLTREVVQYRSDANKMTFWNLDQVARMFANDPDLLPDIMPFITILGIAEELDIASAPLALRNVAEPSGAKQVDFSGAETSSAHGFYEIWMHIEDPVLDAEDPEGRLWVHVSALVGRDQRLHIMARQWPITRAGEN